MKGEKGLRGSVLHSSTRMISVLSALDSMTGRNCNISPKNIFVELSNAISRNSIVKSLAVISHERILKLA